ncbi:GbsR/MarR family transcriptional regulator [Psychrobacter sp. FDAARGOS_221]|uniref:GbsR/MarR family transcriptional regulator n=1 Tax=Psychrobacter sp. FDAARGOS_221 TaxID=1975705 RepID=UPI000BB57AEC|nr:MarR family transcriptional regulator [Psychrobacter sp. FDAARGOS_221]PNK60746.1 MarR family transcriptional regulator [Psychrobacter sp. FDAARGOS_221]
MKLNPATERFVLHWGEMGTQWGVNRTMSQIHALLYIIGRPLNAEEITETLGVARSNVSNSLKELQNWGLVQKVSILGDRRDHFSTHTDVWELARIIVVERQKRELAPTVDFLQSLIDSPEFAQENSEVQTRIKETQEFVDTLTSWSDEMLKLPTSTLKKILKLGARIKKKLG